MQSGHHSQTLASAYNDATINLNHDHTEPFTTNTNNDHTEPFTTNDLSNELDLGEALDIRAATASQVGQLNYNLAVQDILSSLRVQCSQYATKLNIEPQRLLYSVLNISEKEKKSRKLNEWQAWVHLTAKDLRESAVPVSRGGLTSHPQLTMSFGLQASQPTSMRLPLPHQTALLRRPPRPPLRLFKSNLKRFKQKPKRERLRITGHLM